VLGPGARFRPVSNFSLFLLRFWLLVPPFVRLLFWCRRGRCLPVPRCPLRGPPRLVRQRLRWRNLHFQRFCGATVNNVPIPVLTVPYGPTLWEPFVRFCVWAFVGPFWSFGNSFLGVRLPLWAFGNPLKISFGRSSLFSGVRPPFLGVRQNIGRPVFFFSGRSKNCFGRFEQIGRTKKKIRTSRFFENFVRTSLHFFCNFFVRMGRMVQNSESSSFRKA
jgi:hypothetical protein